MSDPMSFRDRAGEIEQLFAGNPIIRAVNFHNAPKAKLDEFDRQLANYSQRFSSVNEAELEEYLSSGKWTKPKPGLIVSVYEGYRNGYDVLRPLLEKHQLVGWFFVITGFINSVVKQELPFALGHDIDMLTREYSDGRYALTWDELRHLDKNHVIASHTRSHQKLALMSAAVRREEVVGAQDQFRKHLGHPVRAFASLTGPPYGENSLTDHLVDAAGYDFVFSNFRIQRIHANHDPRHRAV